MTAGRKPKHAFNTLKLGEKAELKGQARVYPNQFVYQFAKTGKKLKIIRDGKKIFVERVK